MTEREVACRPRNAKDAGEWRRGCPEPSRLRLPRQALGGDFGMGLRGRTGGGGTRGGFQERERKK